MNIGLYNVKYAARKWIEWILPLCRRLDPNWISLSLLVPAGAAAWAYAAGRPFIGIFCILLRMFLGTLDGLVAERFQKGTPQGEIVNRLAPELADAALFAVFAWQDPLWGIPALSMCWLTTFAGLVGKKPQSVGPAGQTDRLAALIVCSLLSPYFDWMRIFLIWCTIGGAATVVLRLKRNLV